MHRNFPPPLPPPASSASTSPTDASHPQHVQHVPRPRSAAPDLQRNPRNKHNLHLSSPVPPPPLLPSGPSSAASSAPLAPFPSPFYAGSLPPPPPTPGPFSPAPRSFSSSSAASSPSVQSAFAAPFYKQARSASNLSLPHALYALPGAATGSSSSLASTAPPVYPGETYLYNSSDPEKSAAASPLLPVSPARFSVLSSPLLPWRPSQISVAGLVRAATAWTKQKRRAGFPPASKAYLLLTAFCVFAFLLFSSSSHSVASPFADNAVAGSVVNGTMSEGAPTAPWAVTYAPMRAGGDCKAPAQIARDLRDIARAGIPRVKLHSPDCRVLEALDAAPALRVQMGLFPYELELAEGEGEGEELTRMQRLLASLSVQLHELAQWGQWHRVDSLIVGASGVHHDAYTRQELVTMLRYVRRVIKGGGADDIDGLRSLGADHVLITTAEPVQSYISRPRFRASSVDAYRARLAHASHQIHAAATALLTKDASADLSADYPALLRAPVAATPASPASYISRLVAAATKSRRPPPPPLSNPALAAMIRADAYLRAARAPHPDDDDLCAHVDTIGLAVRPFHHGAVAGAPSPDTTSSSSSSGSPAGARALLERDTKFARYVCSDQFLGAAAHAASSASARALHVDAASAPRVVVLEAGWPAGGAADGASPPAQRAALAAMLRARDPYTRHRVPVTFYSWEDEAWREPGELGVETRFGVRHLYYP